MPGKIITHDRIVLYSQPNGKGTVQEPVSIDRHGFTGKTDNTKPGRGKTDGRNEHGQFRRKVTFKEAPGGLNTGTIEFEKTQQPDQIELWGDDETIFNLYEHYIPCALLSNPDGWLQGGRMDVRGNVQVTNRSDADGPVRQADGMPTVVSLTVAWDYNIVLLPLAITSQSQAVNSTGLTSITGLGVPNPDNCYPGYSGADKTFYVGALNIGGATANVLYTINGGSTWALTSADPFAAAEDIGWMDHILIGGAGGRTFILLAATSTTDVAAPARIARATVTFGAEATTVWTVENLGANGDIIQALNALFFGRVYAAAAGDIYTSSDHGDTWVVRLTGTTVINGFVKGFDQDCKDVYAFGASNLLLRERNWSNVWDTLVGPSGGGTFTALAIAEDDIIYAGNGQSIYKNTNGGYSTGGWTSLKDFGTARVVKKIELAKGNSQILRVFVDNTTPGTGEVWESFDGGAHFTQLDSVTNAGYNAVYASPLDVNKFWVVGDASGGFGVIHRLSPAASGC